MLCSDFFLEPATMMRPDAKVEKVYRYPKPVDFRKSIGGLSALVGKRSTNPILPGFARP